MSLIDFHHGTDLTSANDLLYRGLDASAAARYNGSGEFWATTDFTVAEWFAKANPANGMPARFHFALPEEVLQLLLARLSGGVIMHSAVNFEFFPASFPLVNQHISNRQVVLVP
jgi:hypothetical protein